MRRVKDNVSFTVDYIHIALRGKDGEGTYLVHFLECNDLLYGPHDFPVIRERHADDENLIPVDA